MLTQAKGSQFITGEDKKSSLEKEFSNVDSAVIQTAFVKIL